MSVASVLTLPGQPTSGTMTYTPLGGDGYSAPFAVQNVALHAVTGDVSGGGVTLNVFFDTRYCTLIAWMAARIAQGTAADADLIFLTSANREPPIVQSVRAEAVASLVSSRQINEVYTPPPWVYPGGDEAAFCGLRALNVDADVFDLSCCLLLYNINVRQRTPTTISLAGRGYN